MIGFESHNKLDLQHCKDTFKTNTHFFLNGPPAMNVHVRRCLTTKFNIAIYKKKKQWGI